MDVCNLSVKDNFVMLLGVKARGIAFEKMYCAGWVGRILPNGTESGGCGAMEEFEEIFEDLEDPRTGNAKRHELHEILVYPVHVTTRKSMGLMMRKLSVTESQRSAQFRGTISRRKPSVASANWAQVA